MATFVDHVRAQEHLYVVHYESAAGVVSETTMDQLPQLLAAGTIKQNTRVWMDGMEGWTELVRRSYNLLQLLLVLIMLGAGRAPARSEGKISAPPSSRRLARRLWRRSGSSWPAFGSRRAAPLRSP